jgi:glutaredoxin
MSKYYIKAIFLEKCQYGLKTELLLKQYNIPYKKIIIKNSEKELYKSNSIKTFPQLYLKKIDSKGNLLLGGYEKLKDFINNLKNKNIKNINNFIHENNWSRKATVRLIQLIN